MGLYQEIMYRRCGKYPEESLFYTHILSMPAFLFLSGNIWSHANQARESPEIFLPSIDRLPIPSQFLYLFLNASLQFVCIKSVYILLTECSSLTVTLVVTLRKFFSLAFSVLYFKNPFTFWHWMGTTFILIGTIIYTELLPKLLAVRSVDVERENGSEISYEPLETFESRKNFPKREVAGTFFKQPSR